MGSGGHLWTERSEVDVVGPLVVDVGERGDHLDLATLGEQKLSHPVASSRLQAGPFRECIDDPPPPVPAAAYDHDDTGRPTRSHVLRWRAEPVCGYFERGS